MLAAALVPAGLCAAAAWFVAVLARVEEDELRAAVAQLRERLHLTPCRGFVLSSEWWHLRSADFQEPGQKKRFPRPKRE